MKATKIPAMSQKAKNGNPQTIGFTLLTKGIIPIVQMKGISVRITFIGFILHTSFFLTHSLYIIVFFPLVYKSI
jgi:hypothetical protein